MNFLRRLVALFKSGTIEQDIDKEMRLHLDLLTRDHELSGMSAQEAQRAARRQFGNVLHIKERGRDIRGAGILGDVLQDVRYGARTFLHNPIFTAVIVLSLALGIGANAALFSLIDAKFFRKLAVRQPDQLVSLGWASFGWSPGQIRGGVVGGRDFKRSAFFSSFAFDKFRTSSTSLSDVIAFAPVFEASSVIDGQPDPVSAQLVSGNYYTALGVPATAGRTFTADDDRTSGAPVAVISYRFWQTGFEQDAGVVGKKVYLNGMPLTIIGVSGPEFRGTSAGRSAPSFSIPLAFAPQLRQWGANAEQNAWWLQIGGRLKPGVAFDQVRGDLEGVFQGVALGSSGSAAPSSVLRLEVVSASRGFGQANSNFVETVIVLGTVFGFLLLIVCLNVANLLLARGAVRQYEIGVRLAMGARRVRLIRQLLTENLLMAFIGGAMGVLLAYWVKDIFTLFRLLGEDLDLRIDHRVLAFTVTVSFVAGILFGLAPAFRATHMDLNSAVKRSLHNSGVSRSRLNKTLLVTQVAMSTVLLVGAGLFLRTLGNWRAVDAGFDTNNMLVFRVNPGTLQYGEARTIAIHEEIVGRIQSLSGVLGITRSSYFWAFWWPAMRIPGDSRTYRPVRGLNIRPNFFETMGMRMLAGRAFTPADGRGAPRVAVIDDTLAKHYFPGTNPIGRRFGLFSGPDTNGSEDIEIVGIVKGMHIPNPKPEDDRPTVYIPELQDASGTTWGHSLQVRTSGDPLALAPAILKVVGEIDPALPVTDIKTMNQGMEERLGPIRNLSLTWSLFGLVGALLTCVGLYGLMSYRIERRTQEIGVRMALGAGRFRVVRLVMRQSFGLVFTGLAIGLASSLAINQIIRSFFFGVTLYDPPTILAVVALLIAVTGIAAFVPARRASRVDPTVALRYE